jgi:hypothetical protein
MPGIGNFLEEERKYAEDNREYILRQMLEQRATKENGKGWTWRLYKIGGFDTYKCEYRRTDDGEPVIAKYVHIPPVEYYIPEELFKRFGSRFVPTTVVRNLRYYDEATEQVRLAPIAYVEDEGQEVLYRSEGGVIAGHLLELDQSDREVAKNIITDFVNMIVEMWQVGLDNDDISLLNAALINDKVRFFDVEGFTTDEPDSLVI